MYVKILVFGSQCGPKKWGFEGWELNGGGFDWLKSKLAEVDRAQAPKSPGFHTTARAQTCTFEFPGGGKREKKATFWAVQGGDWAHLLATSVDCASRAAQSSSRRASL